MAGLEVRYQENRMFCIWTYSASLEWLFNLHSLKSVLIVVLLLETCFTLLCILFHVSYVFVQCITFSYITLHFVYS